MHLLRLFLGNFETTTLSLAWNTIQKFHLTPHLPVLEFVPGPDSQYRYLIYKIPLTRWPLKEIPMIKGRLYQTPLLCYVQSKSLSQIYEICCVIQDSNKIQLSWLDRNILGSVLFLVAVLGGLRNFAYGTNSDAPLWG